MADNTYILKTAEEEAKLQARKRAESNPRVDEFMKMDSEEQEEALKEDEARIGVFGDRPKMKPGEAVISRPTTKFYCPETNTHFSSF